MTAAQTTVGLELIRLLEARGVDVVFGIPGVHTAELYRGLSASSIRHVTPRSEQDAGFMADGYARASGKPGVCLLITGPGLTNAITAMAQARADSIPMLVISGVNALATLGHYRGHLHELPDQIGMIRTLALSSERLERPDDLPEIMARAFSVMRSARPGPVHIEIPTDLMEAPLSVANGQAESAAAHQAPREAIASAAVMCAGAKRPLILAGGGAVWADEALTALADTLDAPVVTTTNARGLLSGHPLCVPASASLAPIRELIDAADLVIAIGTQFGPTDYDAYEDGGFTLPRRLIRIDLDPADDIPADVRIVADARIAATALTREIVGLDRPRDRENGTARAAAARTGTLTALPEKMRALLMTLDTIRDAVPGATIVGDSTQIAYAGNLYFEAAAPRSWFNASTGYGSLGYGPPAAIGAAIGLDGKPVICVVGDGGFQFCLGALGTAVDENTPVIFLVWNNHGYQEIEDYMTMRSIVPIGVRPSAPDFTKIAEAYSIPAQRIDLLPGAAEFSRAELDLAPLVAALKQAHQAGGPRLIEVSTP